MSRVTPLEKPDFCIIAYFVYKFLDSETSPYYNKITYPLWVYKNIFTEMKMEQLKCSEKSCPDCCHYKHTPRDEKTLKSLNDRLSRIIGQLNGIKNMLNDNRYCGDILIQLSAVESALTAFGYEILSDHFKTCVVENVKEGNNFVLDEAIELIKKLK